MITESQHFFKLLYYNILSICKFKTVYTPVLTGLIQLPINKLRNQIKK